MGSGELPFTNLIQNGNTNGSTPELVQLLQLYGDLMNPSHSLANPSTQPDSTGLLSSYLSSDMNNLVSTSDGTTSFPMQHTMLSYSKNRALENQYQSQININSPLFGTNTPQPWIHDDTQTSPTKRKRPISPPTETPLLDEAHLSLLVSNPAPGLGGTVSPNPSNTLGGNNGGSQSITINTPYLESLDGEQWPFPIAEDESKSSFENDEDLSTKYYGVCRVKGRKNRWQVCVYYDKTKRHHVGWYDR